MPKKKRNRKRSLRWHLLWTLAFFFAGACITTLFLSLPLWRISKIKITGSTMVDESLIKEKAAIPLGENIFFVSFAKPLARLATIRQIAKFKIKKSFPSTIVIKAEDRKPFAVVVVSNEARVIDEEGIILKAQDDPNYDFVVILNASNLPVVSGLKRSQVVGYKLDKEVAEAINIAISRSSQFLAGSSLQIEMSDLNNINLLIEDILKVKIGSIKDLEQKMDVLESILAEVRGRWNEVGYIDVKYPKTPVVRFR